jgi:hypothetical protein
LTNPNDYTIESSALVEAKNVLPATKLEILEDLIDGKLDI